MAGSEKRGAASLSIRKPRILVIVEHPTWDKIWKSWISNEAYDRVFVHDTLAWLEEMPKECFDVAVFQYEPELKNAFGIIKLLKRFHPSSQIIAVGPYNVTQEAFQAAQAGAFEYLPLFNLQEQFPHALARAISAATLKDVLEAIRPKSNLASILKFHGMTARSAAMKAIFAEISQFSSRDLPVLITGETGTGKELVADAIHSSSRRSAGPLVKINCAAFAKELLESELFGHEKGSFTGAAERHAGLFERAHGGTLFLDEIGDMEPRLQAKILRVLEEKLVRPLGAKHPIKVDVRIIAATNRKLPELIEEGGFRKDLLYRLSGQKIDVPALCDRPEDILPLAQHFIESICKEEGRSVLELADRAAADLVRHSWPGNVRELFYVIERALVAAQGKQIEPEDLKIHAPAERRENDKQIAPLEETVSNAIERALKAMGGSKRKAALALGINPSTLHRKSKRAKK